MFRWQAPVLTLATILLLHLRWTSALPIAQPARNIWKHLAQTMGKTNICLHAGDEENPLGTCLVGIPSKTRDFPVPTPLGFVPGHQVLSTPIFSRLPPLNHEPLEFRLLGSAPAPYCFIFSPTWYPGRKPVGLVVVRPEKEKYSAPRWCKAVLHLNHAATTDRTPRELPHGTFLICGDHAWAGIPSLLVGGPCTLGPLSLFAPDASKVVNWQKQIDMMGANSSRPKRSLQKFGEDCDPEIVHWPRSKRIAMSVLLPWVAASKALGELGQLECWVAKEANLTARVLSDFLEEERITRQAVLQNRAAIDFLLLKHQHSCVEFHGLCCFNLTSRAKDIRATIGEMQEHLKNIQKESTDWLYHLFSSSGWSGWAASVVKDLIYLLLTLILLLLLGSLLWTGVKRLVARATFPPAIQAAAAVNVPAPNDGNHLQRAPAPDIVYVEAAAVEQIAEEEEDQV